ncbi:Bactericidal permeability-increasing protein [Trichinella pseudospiralis]|uniref:Bactericidal permeability-increasing protein n=1 Tax=Trichinella pseudospiralis TaxID=6337 RepID=A0A0V0YMD2_TRIPS|nr:Bactericidal permeability-increasing protein [Trichinella pseudospiralis]
MMMKQKATKLRLLLWLLLVSVVSSFRFLRRWEQLPIIARFQQSQLMFNNANQPTDQQQVHRQPGILVQLTSSGLNQIVQTLDKVLNEELPNFSMQHLPSAVLLIHTFEVEELRVLSFHSPETFTVELQPNSNDQLKVMVRNLDFSLRITVSSNMIGLRQATFSVFASNVGFNIGLSLSSDSEGNLNLKVGDCQFAMRKVVTLVDEVKGLRIFSNVARSVIKNQLKIFVNSRLCDFLREQIPKEVSNYFQAHSNKMSIWNKSSRNYIASRGDQSDALVNHFDKAFSQIVVDTGLVGNPVVKSNGDVLYLQSGLKGDVLINGKLSTNVKAKFIPTKQLTGNKMLYIGLSEYIASGFLNSLFEIGALNVTLNSQMLPDMKSFLQTTCDGFCFGTFLPNVAEEYPEHSLEIYFSTLKVPLVNFQSENIKLKLVGLLEIRIQSEKEKISIFNANAKMEANFKLYSKSDRVFGQAEIPVLEISPVGVIDMGDLMMEMLNEIPRNVIEEKLNHLLKSGFALPAFEMFRLKNVNLVHTPGAIWVDLDFDFSKAEMHKIVHTILHQKIALLPDFTQQLF